MLRITDATVLDAAEHAVAASDDHHFVGVRCTGGVTGWYGPVSSPLAGNAARLAARLRGHTLTTTRLPHLLTGIAPAECRRAARAALGAVDGAAWDALGKAAGVPVATLLADRPATRVPAYASWLNLDLTRAHHLEHVTSLSAQPWPHTKWAARAGPHTTPTAITDRIAATVTAAHGPVAIDAVGTWTSQLLATLMSNPPADVLWLEDPLPAGHGRLPTGLPLALGEDCTTTPALLKTARTHRPAVLSPDVLWLGGLTATHTAMPALARHETPVWLHGRAFALALHLAAAHPHVIAGVEYQHHWWPRRTTLLTEPFPGAPGYFVLPDRPGLGLAPKGAPPR